MVAYSIYYWPAADAALTRLETDPLKADVWRAVDRTLIRLAEDPFSPRLGTTSFMTEPLAGINATPVRVGEWYVIWQRGEPGSIEIVDVRELPV